MVLHHVAVQLCIFMEYKCNIYEGGYTCQQQNIEHCSTSVQCYNTHSSQLLLQTVRSFEHTQDKRGDSGMCNHISDVTTTKEQNHVRATISRHFAASCSWYTKFNTCRAHAEKRPTTISSSIVVLVDRSTCDIRHIIFAYQEAPPLVLCMSNTAIMNLTFVHCDCQMSLGHWIALATNTLGI